jgi:hypothetical protein
MVNHWFNEDADKTACEEYGGTLAESISVDHWDSVSCPDCLGADYPAISARDIELRDFGKYKWVEYDHDPENLGHRRCMIFRPRTISTACDDCRMSDVYCQSVRDMERRPCCDTCTH